MKQDKNLSPAMCRLLAEVRDWRIPRTLYWANLSTLDALVRRGLVERSAGDRYRRTPHGRIVAKRIAMLEAFLDERGGIQ